MTLLLKWQYEAIKKLLDICWDIRRSNLEGGDIYAGQLLDINFENTIDQATKAFGFLGIIREEENDKS